MKFTDLTIDQFQRIAAVEMTAEDAIKKVAIYAIIKGVTLDEAKAVKMSEVNAEYKAIESELKALPSLKFKQDVKVQGKRFRLSLYTDTLSAGQLLELMSYPMQNDYEVIQNLHKIMATLARERTWWRTLPYDGAGHPERAELFKQATMGDVWGACSFFLMASDDYLRIFQIFSEAKLRTMAKELASHTSTAG